MKSLITFTILATLLLTACGEQKTPKQVAQQAVKIESGDECHLCGMLIQGFAGPKGELYLNPQFASASQQQVKKFCSTRDMLAFYLDPEHQRNIQTMLVHDMSKAPWQHPNDDYFIDARTAWFVVGSDKMGAMGKTLATFSKKQDAQAFAEQFHGTVKAFADISLDDLNQD